MSRTCINCKVVLTKRYKIKFCSNKCQADYRYKLFVVAWKKESTKGLIGVRAKNISAYLRKYILKKYEDKCVLCGWNKRNPLTNKPAVEVDHIDGDSNNNSENNLRLLCPNCHSLTPYFKNLNRGRGRKWRTEKYMKHT